jgi:uncharacterized Zn-binding protein involved in type VI secretion
MPEAARGDATETVNTVHVATGDADPTDGSFCDVAPITTSTDVCSGKVFAQGIGVVRKGDAVTAHPIGGTCSTHTPGLAAGSGKVFIETKGAGRKGDTYTCSAKITSGSGKVFLGG